MPGQQREGNSVCERKRDKLYRLLKDWVEGRMSNLKDLRLVSDLSKWYCMVGAVSGVRSL